MMSWDKFQESIAGINLGQSATRFAKGFNSSVQATKERLGQVASDEITELPQGTHAYFRLLSFFFSDASILRI
jgi:hypothetical protein